jgi:hypothetical protein
MGYRAGAGNVGTSNTIAMGSEAGEGAIGVSNIFLGTETRSAIGSSNIFIGHGIDLSSVSNQVRIGLGTNTPIAADLVTNWVGLTGLTNPLDANNKLDVSGNVRIQGQLGINITPGTRTLDVNGNFRAQDASANVLDFSAGLTRSSAGFASVRGSNVVAHTSNVSIGTLKTGIVIIAVRSGSANFDGRTEFVLDTTSPIVSNLSSNKSVTTTVNFTSNSINISNTTGGSLTYDWTITYFPLP